jgi:hypothetical protein
MVAMADIPTPYSDGISKTGHPDSKLFPSTLMTTTGKALDDQRTE